MNPYSTEEFRRHLYVVPDREQERISDKTLRRLTWGGGLLLCIVFWVAVVWLACEAI